MTESLIGPIISTGIVVRDLEAATAFYRDVFDLELVRDVAHVDSAAGPMLGLPVGAPVRYRLFASGEGMIGMVSLFEIGQSAILAAPHPSEGARAGETIVIFRCPRLDEVRDRLARRGHPLVCPPHDIHSPDGSTNREMTFRDPDGTLINIMDIRPNGDK